MENGQGPGFLSGISLRTLRRAYNAPKSQLTEEEAASTLFRFFRSKHVVDLRLIVVTVLGLLGIYIIFIIIVLVEFTQADADVFQQWLAPPTHGGKIEPDLAVKLIGPAVGIAGLIISWAYKAASTRLGIIDLFGCEIGTLCRVGTIFDIGRYYIRAYYIGAYDAKDEGAEKRDSFDKYTSQEHYFPIFDNNSRDLELLEALIVCRITEFYTYMKASRDTRRLLATIPLPKEMPSPEGGATGPPTPWHAALLNVVYMTFLGYEAGRKAIDYLIEFEPAAAANTLTIMITELTCYGLLLSNLKDDLLRYPRLQLRRENYKIITPELYRRIDSPHGKNEKYWRPACELLPQLRDRYKDALGETMDEALARLEQTATADAAPPSSRPLRWLFFLN
jgi:hypothetical protein